MLCCIVTIPEMKITLISNERKKMCIRFADGQGGGPVATGRP